MSYQLDRIKSALSSTVLKLRSDIEKTHKAGKIPADYSLGFTNGLIFAEHHINFRPGDPKFYNRTTSIGSLPKPVVLQTEKFSKVQGASEINESLRDSIIIAVRNLDAKDTVSFLNLQMAIKKLDEFEKQMSEMESELNKAGQGESDSVADESANGQDGSSPSPANTTKE